LTNHNLLLQDFSIRGIIVAQITTGMMWVSPAPVIDILTVLRQQLVNERIRNPHLSK